MTVSPGARTDVDADLVEALRREEPEAAEQLVERFGDRVYRLAQRITGVKEDAEEAAQDALWTAARKIGTFKGESAFGSWLYRIAANAAYQNATITVVALAWTDTSGNVGAGTYYAVAQQTDAAGNTGASAAYGPFVR